MVGSELIVEDVDTTDGSNVEATAICEAIVKPANPATVGPTIRSQLLFSLPCLAFSSVLMGLGAFVTKATAEGVQEIARSAPV